MMNPLTRALSGALSGGLLNVAVSRCAALFVAWLDGLGDPSRAVSPEQLHQLAAGGQNVILQSLSQTSGPAIASVRTMFGSVASAFRAEQAGPQGQKLGHPYMWVLQELAKTHPQHAQVIVRHLGWYRACMDQALDWLFGPRPPNGSPG